MGSEALARTKKYCKHPSQEVNQVPAVNVTNALPLSYRDRLHHQPVVRLFYSLCLCERAHCQSTHFGRRPKYNSLPVAYLLRIFNKRVSLEFERELERSWKRVRELVES